MDPMSLFRSPSQYTRRTIVATCNLNQWALDFSGNRDRILESIYKAKSLGAKLRVGPELEVSGYSCEDHFLELDTYLHAYDVLAKILSTDATDDIICDIGCPILHNNVRYNCKILCLNRKILLIRPKLDLADDGNYRERRYFTSWKSYTDMTSFRLPEVLQAVTGQVNVPMGAAIIRTNDTMIAVEICEELWSPVSPHLSYALSGVEIICNGSGSHHQLRKLNERLTLLQDATKKYGGLYLYSNHRGCDGNRLYFDGCSLICMNGSLLAQASQFSLQDIEVVTAKVDLNDVLTYRQSSASFQHHSSVQAISTEPIPIIDVNFYMTIDKTKSLRLNRISVQIAARVHIPEEECALGPACWLWDYLRRSGASGFLLPLSGGADSSSVATIVYIMCNIAIQEANNGNIQVMKDIATIMRVPEDNYDQFVKSLTPQELCNAILHTIYLGSNNSSSATRRRALVLSESIGSYHNTLSIEEIVNTILITFSSLTSGKLPRYESQGGSRAEDIALQNIQARIRMVLAYLCAQLFPWMRGKPGYLLVLGSANVDEALRGYMTKYDCSSADINPIGGICKKDLKSLLNWASYSYPLSVLKEIVEAPPTAELRPIAENEKNDYTQTDEEDMGMTYDELGIFGSLRKVSRCGPVTMFLKLLEVWKNMTPSKVAEKVKRFFYYYSINRHKMTTLTPSYHAENYSPDDNRFDLRQFLYNTKWTEQFATIDALLIQSEEDNI